jgi:hypothetical protein
MTYLHKDGKIKTENVFSLMIYNFRRTFSNIIPLLRGIIPIYDNIINILLVQVGILSDHLLTSVHRAVTVSPVKL